jgi:hypothetical protein
MFLVPDVSHASPSDEDDENEFYDARDEDSNQDTEANFILKIPLGHRRNSSGVSLGSQVKLGFTITVYNSLRYKMMAVLFIRYIKAVV